VRQVKTPVIVTGGASGIGLATVERLLDEGWPVAVIDIDEEALHDAQEELDGEDALFLSADVSDEEIVGAAFDRIVDTMGPISGLVNCAGIVRDIPVMETSPELFRQVLDINVVGSFICAKAAIERMADSLSIVNISSVAGLLGSKGRVAYGASKAAVKSMTEVMANELGTKDIRVNAIAPGPVNTPLIARLHTPEDRKLWTDRVPQRRYSEPLEIAAAISFLISSDASFVNGHTLVVDGGFSIAGIMVDE
jgi:NAD(P)-dependent dehydrogenase (short-subunit alcohol dehydrogenase family)